VEGHKVVKISAVDRRDVAIDGMARAQVTVQNQNPTEPQVFNRKPYTLILKP
jgi:hypothetical protein